MRGLPAAFLGLSLPLLLAAAPADAPAADIPLRLTPTSPNGLEIPLHLPSAAAPATAEPLSFGPQRIAFPAGVNASFDIVYGSLKGFRPLTLDLYQPPAQSGGRPLLVFVHGGGWNGGDTRHAASYADFPRALAALAAKGYVVASVSYRLSGEARFPGAVQDIKAAIRWLRGAADKLNIDGTRVAVWGDGAGGLLAALVGVTCGVVPFEPDSGDNGERPSDCVQAVIDWGGISDLESLAAKGDDAKTTSGFAPPPTSEAGDFLGCEPARCPPMLARLASPLAFISATNPAFLIQHGEADNEVPVAQAQKLYDALHKAGAQAELVVYPGVGKGFAPGGTKDSSDLKAAQDKIAQFLAQVFPATPIGPRLAQPRGSLY
ncbi:MAG: alpha/beta hydrolase [Alphaproteobacteria bacterium]|nr:alpha/beta hydrolase [Alphaproteobacteria bacterium]